MIRELLRRHTLRHHAHKDPQGRNAAVVTFVLLVILVPERAAARVSGLRLWRQ
jgi:hypothetical protein